MQVNAYPAEVVFHSLTFYLCGPRIHVFAKTFFLKIYAFNAPWILLDQHGSSFSSGYPDRPMVFGPNPLAFILWVLLLKGFGISHIKKKYE